MVGTILKHELSRTFKPMLLVTGVVVLFELFLGLTAMIDPKLAFVLVALTMWGWLPIVQWYLGIEFYVSSYAGRAAKLTHLLPVSGAKLFWSKFLYMTLVSLAILLILIGLYTLEIVWAVHATGGDAMAVRMVFDSIFKLYAESPGLVAISLLFVGYGLWGTPMVLTFSAIIGSGGWARKLSVGGPIIVFFALGFIFQVVVPIALALLGVDGGQEEIATDSAAMSYIMTPSEWLPITSTAIIFVLMLPLPFIAGWHMNRKLELST